MKLDSDQVGLMASKIDGMKAQDVVRWALERFDSKIVFASSFGAEDVVVIDMLMKVNPKARVITLDTGRLHQETYNVMDSICARYGLQLEVFFPEAGATEAMVREHGLNLFYQSVDLRTLCCGVRKVEPLRRALSGLDAWMTGLRRDQNVTRTTLPKLEWDGGHKLAKVNPIADWSHEDVWSYIRANNVPYNALHDRGFPSIGCEPCTRAVQPGEDLRAGRWWWEHPESKECGLHVITKHLAPSR